MPERLSEYVVISVVSAVFIPQTIFAYATPKTSWRAVVSAALENAQSAGKAVSPRSTPRSPSLPADTVPFNGHSYKFFTEKLTWKDAKEKCAAIGGRLVIIDSADENGFVASLITKAGWLDAWIGITDAAQEGSWRSVDGKPLSYTNWYANQPNNKGGEEHYAIISNRTFGKPLGWTWSDQPNQSKQHEPGYVCEWDSTSPSSNVSDPTPGTSQPQGWSAASPFKAGQVWEGLYQPAKKQDLPFRMKVTKVDAGKFEGEMYLMQFNVEGHGAAIAGKFGAGNQFEVSFTQPIRGTWLDASLKDGRIEGEFISVGLNGKWIIPSAKSDGRFQGRLVESRKHLAKSTVSSTPAPALNDRTYTKWRDYILPKPEELSWLEIPWRATFWDAVIEAQQKDKPILVWAMTGDPLGCT